MTDQPTHNDGDLWTQTDGKNRAARTAEIPLALGKFGVGEFVERARWSRWLPGRPDDQAQVDNDEAGGGPAAHSA